MPTLAQLIEAYEARQPAPIVLTPAARARVAARRLARVLPELDPGARIAVANVVLAELARLNAGRAYNLMESRPPVLDPQL